MLRYSGCSTARNSSARLPTVDSGFASIVSRGVAVRLAADGRLRAANSSCSWRRSKNGFPYRRLSICFSRRKPLQAAASFRDGLLADLQQTEDVAKKVTRTVLSVAVACNLLLYARSRPAIACIQAGLPGSSRAAAVCNKVLGRTKLESVGVGALWGCGHDAGQLIFGIIFLFLKDKLHLEIIRTWGARVVAMTLLTIGVLGIKEAEEIAVPCLAGNGPSLSSTLSPSQSFKGTKKKIGLATFATGVVHGLQPDAVLMILPAVALPSRLQGAAFLGMFLLGTVLAMSSYTAFIGSCSHALQDRVPMITKHLSWGSSLVAILVGAAILVGELFGWIIF